VRPGVLALRALGLGDFLTGVPALRVLRDALPDHRVVLAAPVELAPLVRLSDTVDDLLPTRELEPVRWAGPAPEVAVDLHGNGPASLQLVARLGAPRVVSYAADEGPRWRAEEHEVTRWCRLVAWSLGTGDDPAPAPTSAALRLRRPVTASPAPGAVVVHVGAAAPSRRWPPDRFAAVVRALADDGHRVVLTGSAGETPAAERVRELADRPGVEVTAGRLHLGQLTALVAQARLVVCGDTGVAHLASAYAVPSVLLFGPVTPAAWGPPADGPHVVLWHGDGTGDPHATQTDPALLRTTTAEVTAAARRLLSEGDRVPLPRQRSGAPPVGGGTADGPGAALGHRSATGARP
jgi:ADP-heptose:LPS heptosyltransferase